MPDVFIGLVSHERSRFARSQGPDGLASGLARGLSELGLTTAVQVNTANLFDPSSQAIGPAVVRRSIDAQMRLGRRWRRYLRAGSASSPGSRTVSSTRDALAFTVLAAQGYWQFLGPGHSAAGTNMVRRLLNIELSHLDLMHAAIASGAPWSLILEDDAHALDLHDACLGLASLITSYRDSKQPAYVNVSHSHSLGELGVADLMSPADGASWAGDTTRSVEAASRPVSNTVCAILYRTSFLVDLVATLGDLPLEPVVPIDWKLNLALMQLFESGDLGNRDCWMIEPGPFDQLSMQSGAS